MAGPDKSIVQQLPISIYSGWDKVQDILQVLAQHDYGQFRSSAMLVDTMWRDDRIKGVLGARLGAVLASPLEHKPADQSRKAKKAMEYLGGSETEPGGVWDLICPPSTLKAMAGWAVTEGIVVAELIWVEHPTIRIGKFPMWVPRLRVWHPQFVYWDWSTFSYVLLTREGPIHLPRTDRAVYSDGKWFVYCPDGYQYGWLRAAVRSLAMLYVSRGWANRDWSRHSEVHGQAIRKVFVPEGANEEEKQEFYNDAANAGSELSVMVPVPDEGRDKGFDIVYEEAKARTWECMKDLKAGKEVDIAVDLVGQNMSTETSGSGLGAGAVAHLQGQVRIDIRKGDALIVPALRNQVVSWWALYNFGDPELAPRSELQVDPPEDELADATALKMLGDGLQALKTASERTDVEAIMDAKGVPMLTDEELDAERQVKLDRQQEMMDAMGGPQPAPGEEKQPPQKDAGDEKKPAPPPGRKKQARLALAALANHPTPGPVQRKVFQELPIAVENPTGTVRNWYDPGAATPRGSTTMQHDYGYIEGYEGADGEDLDVYLGPDETAQVVHVVHQMAPPDYKRYDEDKIFLGFPSADAARAAYAAHRHDGEAAIGGMSTLPLERFKAKLKRRTGRGKITAASANGAGPTLGWLVAGARSAGLEVAELVVRHEANGWNVYSEAGKHLGGPYKSKVEAEHRLRQVEWFKNKGHASAAEIGDTVSALEALVARIEGKPTAQLRTIAGTRRSARYADRLTVKAKKLATRALAVDLATIKGEIEKATSFDDLKARITAAYRDKMDPEKLAKVIHKARLMAHLYGRLTAVDGL